MTTAGRLYAGATWQNVPAGPWCALSSHLQGPLVPGGVWEPFANLLSSFMPTTRRVQVSTPHVETVDSKKGMSALEQAAPGRTPQAASGPARSGRAC